MKKQIYKLSRTSAFLACLVCLTFTACSDDELSNSNSNRGDLVSFEVSDASDEINQNATTTPADEITHTHFTEQLNKLNLKIEDLTHQKITLHNSAGKDGELLETTVAGITSSTPAEPIQDSTSTSTTRAYVMNYDNLSKSIFSSIGYRSNSESDVTTINSTPWFYNQDTDGKGKLRNQILWDWAYRYAKFYGISPKFDSKYTKIKVSPNDYTSKPYIDFEVEKDVKQQKDLMTACSGVITYQTQGFAPTSHLRFHHALTAVRFKVGENLSYNKTIVKVEISNALSKGRYTLSTNADGLDATWSDLSDRTTFTLEGLTTTTNKSVGNTIIGTSNDNGTFMMIPQQLTGNNVVAKIYFQDGSHLRATLKGEWVAGTTKTYAISEKNSDWEYILAVNPKRSLNYSSTSTTYEIQSYQRNSNGNQRPVSWKIVGYQESIDGGETFGEKMDTKPEWLTTLQAESGNGSTYSQRFNATLTPNIVDFLAQYNQVLKDAPAKGNGSPYNLSNSTGGEQIQNTANSYLISAPGTYRIPLVYGNAIKNGATNENSYKTSATGREVLQVFTDHKNSPITTPYINIQNQDNPANQASIVWADRQGLIQNLNVTGSGQNSFVEFTVTKENIQSGNAIIGIKNANGVTMWSWHLWFAQEKELNTIEVNNYNNIRYQFSTSPLGFAYIKWNASQHKKPRVVRLLVEQTAGNGGVKQTASIDIEHKPHESKEISAPYYQWGRKDPMPFITIERAQNITWVNEGSSNIVNESTKLTIGDRIQHPETYYVSTTPSLFKDSTWARGYVLYDNLWSTHNTKFTTGDVYFPEGDETVVKTIYDPCPVGFNVPPVNAFSGFTKNGGRLTYFSSAPQDIYTIGERSRGWHLNTGINNAPIFFHSLAYRRNDTGASEGSNASGSYWTATPHHEGYKSTYAQGFSASWNSVGTEDTGRHFGKLIQPVREKQY